MAASRARTRLLRSRGLEANSDRIIINLIDGRIKSRPQSGRTNKDRPVITKNSICLKQAALCGYLKMCANFAMTVCHNETGTSLLREIQEYSKVAELPVIINNTCLRKHRTCIPFIDRFSRLNLHCNVKTVVHSLLDSSGFIAIANNIYVSCRIRKLIHSCGTRLHAQG